MAQAVAPIAAIRIKNILFATDFSETSANAVPYLACIARHFGATIFPTYVIPGEPRYEIPMDQITEELRSSRRDAELSIAKVIANPLLRDLPHQVMVERGEVWEEIHQIVNVYDVDMIVIGTHGRGAVGKALFGSVAEQVYRQAKCPVMVVGPRAALHRVEADGFKRILFSTDCSDMSLKQLPIVADLANAFGAFLKVVNVVSESAELMTRERSEVLRRKQEILERALSSVPLVHQAEIVVEIGAVGDVILKLADINNVDLIVMGPRKSPSPTVCSHVRVGTTHLVASHAHCPVLTVRLGDFETPGIGASEGSMS